MYKRQDQAISHQSQRLDIYQEELNRLIDARQAFACDCSRQRIKSIGGNYDGYCRERSLDFDKNTATRVRWNQDIQWHDLVLGPQAFSPQTNGGDFVIKRRDGLFSYQLAVAIDDSLQKITQVIRGEDLLDSTARQIHLQQSLKLSSPEYGHLPTLKEKSGQKLSKQNYATPLDNNNASANLVLALQVLGQTTEPDLSKETPESILTIAAKRWHREQVPTSSAYIEDYAH